jgi:hypothetical protein
MVTKSFTKVLLSMFVLVSLALTSRADVKVSEGNGVNITMENDALKLNIAVEGGGRISSLIDKKTGKDLVTLWKSPTEDGGLLDDRNVFTAMAYSAAVTQPGGKSGIVRLTATNPNGMSMTKIIELRDGESTVEVNETFSNGTQKEARFMLRSFLLPGGGPLTEDDQYFLPVKDKPLQPLIPANGYFEDLASPWSALWNKQSGDGFVVAAPGINQFYFWQGSKIFPTYEWVYPNVPAGKSISVNYALRLIDNATPDWQMLSTETLKGLHGVRFADVPNWQNEEQRYNVTDAERARGFWLSTGDGEGKRRLPALRIDVPENQSRSVYIGINALKDFADSDLQVQQNNIPKNLLTTSWQVSGSDFIKVLSFEGSRKVDLKNGTDGQLWLTLNGGSKPSDNKGEIAISLNGQKVLLPIEVKVWPVNVPNIQPFHLRGYGTLTPMTGGYDITPETLKMTETLFKAYHEIGGDVLDWSVSWPNMDRNLKIAGTDQTVTAWRKLHLKEFETKVPADWPKVDFSYYDPWVELAKQYGVTRVASYMGFQPRNMTPAEEDWMLVNLKTYLQDQGLQGFFCKIADEISPENIPDYIVAAKRARADGWRPFTTVTGLIARTASDINQINPYLDEWQLGYGSTEFFKNITTQPYALETKTTAVPNQWGKYGNGGAKSTFGQKLFGTLIKSDPAETENIGVFQDGKPLQRIGGSPWGNQLPGAFVAGISDYLYVSPFEGTDINTAKITLQYQVRVPAKTGEPLAKIDPTDEVWFYGGGSRTYKNSYGAAAAYPLKALQGNYGGYGLYAFYRWNVDKILFYDKDTEQVSFSPAYLGYKDGWDDACLMAWLRDSKKIPLSQFFAESPNAPLRIGDVQSEVYRWKSIVNLTDPFILNDARIKMLEAATKK